MEWPSDNARGLLGDGLQSKIAYGHKSQVLRVLRSNVLGIEFDEEGRVRELSIPYPGSNLFSLASGGAIYIRDPYGKVVNEQLNGGEVVPLSQADWDLILPYLKENEKLFGISIEKDLLSVKGEPRQFAEVYRKVQPVKTTVLSATKPASAKTAAPAK